MSAASSGLPSSNRGVSRKGEGLGCMLDWLACSLDLKALLTGYDLPVSVTRAVAQVAEAPHVARWCALAAVARVLDSTAFVVADEPKPGRFYAWRLGLKNASGQSVGMVEVGGHHTDRNDGTPTLRLELTGEGCRLFAGERDHAQRWSSLAESLVQFNGRLTRVDIAVDDFEGIRPLAWCMEQYDEGAFKKRGQMPNAELIEHRGNLRRGNTFYIGSRSSEQFLRCYEKGAQLGDEASEWVRYEVQFKGSSRRILPFEMLERPADYFKGAYPNLDFVQGQAERISLLQKVADATVMHAVRHFRRQYGPALNTVLRASEGDMNLILKMCVGIARPTTPGWFKGPETLVSLRQHLAH